MTATAGPPASPGTRPPTAAPAPSFAHLARLSDDTGLFEHARHAIARREHGYCTDDVARGLVVTSREPRPDRRRCSRLAERYLAFLTHAQDADGAFHNRLGYDRRWTDEPGARRLVGPRAVGAGHRRRPQPRRRGSGRRRWSPSAGAPPGGRPAPHAMAFAGARRGRGAAPPPGPRRRGGAAGGRGHARSARPAPTRGGPGRSRG